MVGFGRRLVAALVLAATLATSGMADAAAGPEATARADRLFEALRKDGPALSVAVSQGGDIVYRRAFGEADIEHGVAATSETVFHVASTSKQFTALAILLLVQEGKVDLNADIRSYLPYVPDFGRRITLANLLNHTSGLRDQWGLFRLGGTDMQSLLRQDAVLELVRRQTALNFDPETEFDYSNTGYTLLADVVRRVSGQSLREFTTQRIFRPLGMTHTFFYDDPGELVPGRAVSYVLKPDGAPQLLRLNFATVGATGLSTTSDDLLKWGRELLHPQVFPLALITEMGAPGRLTDGTALAYGLGLYRSEIAGHGALGHDGSDAGFRASLQAFPAEDTVVVVLASGALPAADYGSGLADIFLNGGSGRPPPSAPAPAIATLRALAGYYVNDWSKGLRLQVLGGALTESAAGEAGVTASFRPDGSFSLGAQGVFHPQYGTDGQVVRLEQDVKFGGHRIVHRPAKPDAPSQAGLRAVSGLYRSPELDITYAVALCGGHLVATTSRRPRAIRLEPSDLDRFDSASERWTVRRDAMGQPIALLVDSNGGRIRNLVMNRIGGAAPGVACPT